jgi:ATP-dependent RNA helicase DDX10/DBP4
VSYLRSIHLQKDKSVFKLDELTFECFAGLMGLAGAPEFKFSNKQSAHAKQKSALKDERLRRVKESRDVENDQSGDESRESAEDGDNSASTSGEVTWHGSR